VAAANDYFFAKPWLGAAVSLAFNAFPFERAPCAQVRATLAGCRGLVQEGWSLLLYPEGTRSTTGSIAPFKPGLGFLAVNLGVPVVPVYLGETSSILPKGGRLPRKGSLTIRFGKPVTFSSGDRYRDAALAIERSVRALESVPATGGACTGTAMGAGIHSAGSIGESEGTL